MHSRTSGRHHSPAKRRLQPWLPLLTIIAGLPFLLRGAWLVATGLLWLLGSTEITAVVTKAERYEQRIRKPAPSHLEPYWRGEYRFTLPDTTSVAGTFDSDLFVGHSHSEFSVGTPLVVRYLSLSPATSRPAALNSSANFVLALMMLVFGIVLVAAGLFTHALGRPTPSP